MTSAHGPDHEQLLEAIVAGDRSPEEAAGCARCEAQLAGFDQVVARLRAAAETEHAGLHEPREALPAALQARVDQHLLQAIRGSTRKPLPTRVRLAPALWIAAAAAVVVALALYFQPSNEAVDPGGPLGASNLLCLEPSAGDTTIARFRWRAEAGADHYEIWLRTDASGGFEKLTRVPAPETEWVPAPGRMPAAAPLEYEIRAFDATGSLLRSCSGEVGPPR